MTNLPTKFLLSSFMAILAGAIFFRQFTTVDTISNSVNIEINLSSNKILSRTHPQCEYVDLPFNPVGILPTHTNAIWMTDEAGESHYISVFSMQKRCKEIAAIQYGLSSNNIRYTEGLVVLNPYVLKPEVISKALKEINQSISYKPKSLQINTSMETPVKHIMYENGKIDEFTEANYGTSIPRSYYPKKGVGFDVFASTTFGLRAFYINAKGDVVSEGGDYNTAFYSVADYKNKTLLVSQPGSGKIFTYNKMNGQLSVLIDGYSATSIRVFNNKLYFAGYVFGKKWDRTALYEYNFITKQIRMLTKPIFADVRGMALYGGKFYISDGAHHRLAVLDANTYRVLYYWLGFNYPNGISITSHGSMLVADEHAGVIREVDLQTLQELRSVGYGLVRSPAYAQEVAFGPYKGNWLIADADNNRLILIDPNTTEIHAEIGGLRSVFDFVILPLTS